MPIISCCSRYTKILLLYIYILFFSPPWRIARLFVAACATAVFACVAFYTDVSHGYTCRENGFLVGTQQRSYFLRVTKLHVLLVWTDRSKTRLFVDSTDRRLIHNRFGPNVIFKKKCVFLTFVSRVAKSNFFHESSRTSPPSLLHFPR